MNDHWFQPSAGATGPAKASAKDDQAEVQYLSMSLPFVCTTEWLTKFLQQPSQDYYPP